MRFTYEALLCIDDEGVYHAHLPDIESCWASADSYGEVIDALAAILEEYLEATLAAGDEAPPAQYDHRVYEGFFPVLLCVHARECTSSDVVSAAEAARMLGVSRPRVTVLVQKGMLHGYRKGRNLLVSLQSIYDRLRYYPRPTASVSSYEGPDDVDVLNDEPLFDLIHPSYESEDY